MSVRKKQVAALKELYADAEVDVDKAAGNVPLEEYRKGVCEGIKRVALHFFGVIDADEITNGE